MSEPLDVLAIGAHPDDVEMTSGGYMALAVSQGKRVGALHLTKGEMGTRGTPEERVTEAEAAANALGLTEIAFAGLQDGHVHCDEPSVLAVVNAIRKFKPTLIIAPYPICHHPDHEEAAKLCIRAIHFAGKVKYLAEGEPHNVGGLIHARYSYPFEPSFYVDVSSVLETKLKAIACYGSQFTARAGEPTTRLSNPTFVDQLIARGQAQGLTTGVEYSEAYRSYGPLVLTDPLAIFENQAPVPTLTR